MTQRPLYDAIHAYLAAHPRSSARRLMRATGCTREEAQRYRASFRRHKTRPRGRNPLVDPQTDAEEAVALIYVAEMKSLIRKQLRTK